MIDDKIIYHTYSSIFTKNPHISILKIPVLGYTNGMANTKGSTKTIDDYLILLKNLEFSQKLQIISELSESMIKENEEKDKDTLFFSLCGKLQLDKDIDIFLNDIREARYFNRSREIDI